jgi:hypothetical protein
MEAGPHSQVLYSMFRFVRGVRTGVARAGLVGEPFDPALD